MDQKVLTDLVTMIECIAFNDWKDHQGVRVRDTPVWMRFRDALEAEKLPPTLGDNVAVALVKANLEDIEGLLTQTRNVLKGLPVKIPLVQKHNPDDLVQILELREVAKAYLKDLKKSRYAAFHESTKKEGDKALTSKERAYLNRLDKKIDKVESSLIVRDGLKDQTNEKVRKAKN